MTCRATLVASALTLMRTSYFLRDGGPARPDVVQRVPAGQVTLAEPDPGALRLGDPVEPEGAPVVAIEVVGDEVPPMVEGHEPLWLDVPPGQVAAAGGVPEPQAFVVAAGLRDLRQRAGVDHGPARRAADGLAAERVHPAPQPGRHHRHDLGQRLDRALLEPGHRAAGRSPQPDRDRDRLVVVQQQRRQGGAGLQLVAAGHAACGVDRIAQLAQPLDVAAQGARADLETFGELGPGQ